MASSTKAHVVCLVQSTDEHVNFTWQQGPDSFPTYAISKLPLEQEISNTRSSLSDLVNSYLRYLKNPNESDNSAKLGDACFNLAKAGCTLREKIFKPAQRDHKQTAREVQDWLQFLHQQQEIAALEIVTEGTCLIPWTLLYDCMPTNWTFQQEPDLWSPFWGLRYNLACSLRVDALRPTPMRRVPWGENIRILLVVDSKALGDLPEPLKHRLESFALTHNLEIIDNKQSLAKSLKTGRPDLLYWFGHASPEALYLGPGNDAMISPIDLAKLLEASDDDHEGGLVFLNACLTATPSSSQGSFFQAVYGSTMSGLIATEHETIDTFACAFGLDFLEAVLVRAEPVGFALQQLRARVPGELLHYPNQVLLGILYGTYCPPELKLACPPAIDVGRAPSGQSRISADSDRSQDPLSTAAASSGNLLSTRAELQLELPERPYRSLQYYDRGDRPLFAGREGDVFRCARILAEMETRLLVLHGETGCGKSSFLRAGLLPYLEDECVGYRVLNAHWSEQARPLFIRATGDLAGQLAQSIIDFCQQPWSHETPIKGQRVVVDLPAILREVLDTQSSLTPLDQLVAEPQLIGKCLAAIGQALPFTLMLVIDQCEEIFTLNWRKENWPRRNLAHAVLRNLLIPADFKVILALRTEYFGRLVDGLRRGVRETTGVREYLLTDFDKERLTEAILRPTSVQRAAYCREAPSAKYGFHFEPGGPDGLAGDIADLVLAQTRNRQDSVLPLVQVICAQLYELVQNRENKAITHEDLKSIGGVQGGLRLYLDQLLQRQFPNAKDRQAFLRFCAYLCRTQPDGTLTSELLPESEARQRWHGRLTFEQLCNVVGQGESQILRITNLRVADGERPYYGLRHDALAPPLMLLRDESERYFRIRRLVLRTTASILLPLMTLFAVWFGFRTHSLTERLSQTSGPMVSDLGQRFGVQSWTRFRIWIASKSDLPWQWRLIAYPIDSSHQDVLQEQLLVCRWENFDALYSALATGPKAEQFMNFLRRSRSIEIRSNWQSVQEAGDNATSRGFRAEMAFALSTLKNQSLANEPNPDWNFLALMSVQVDSDDRIPVAKILTRLKENLDPPLRKIMIEDTLDFKQREMREIPGYWRHSAAHTLRDFYRSDAATLCDLATQTTFPRFEILLEDILSNKDPKMRAKAVEELKKIVDSNTSSKELPQKEFEKELVKRGKRRASAAFALLRLSKFNLNEDDLEKAVLQKQALTCLEMDEHNPEAQTQFIHTFNDYHITPEDIFELYKSKFMPMKLPEVEFNEPSWKHKDDTQFALLLSLGKVAKSLSKTQSSELLTHANGLYRQHPYPSIHAAARWLIIQLNWAFDPEEESPTINSYLGEIDTYFHTEDGSIFQNQRGPESKRLWFIREFKGLNRPIYRTFVRCDGGMQFPTGDLPDPDNANSREPRYPLRDFNRRRETKEFQHRFAICTQEVTCEEYEVYLQAMKMQAMELQAMELKRIEYDQAKTWVWDDKRFERMRYFSPNDWNPINRATWLDATNFCRWLNSESGMRDEDQLYPEYVGSANKRKEIVFPEIENEEGEPNNEKIFAFRGYRLPLQDEFEYAVRANTHTSFSFGSDQTLLTQYSWFQDNRKSNLLTKLGGLKMPTPWGLSDAHGNMIEWCLDLGFNIKDDGVAKERDMLRRAARGGGWLEPEFKCRTAWLYKYNPTNTDASTGFRLVCTPRDE